MTPAAAFTRLIALTEKARLAAGAAVTRIDDWPFRVGREARSSAHVVSADRRRGESPLNDLFLREDEEVRHVSREHFRIECDGAKIMLVDVGSLNGTVVEGVLVGGNRTGGCIDLHDHDVIVVGSASSPFLFKFRSG